MKNTTIKKLLSLFLAITIMACVVPVGAFTLTASASAVNVKKSEVKNEVINIDWQGGSIGFKDLPLEYEVEYDFELCGDFDIIIGNAYINETHYEGIYKNIKLSKIWITSNTEDDVKEYDVISLFDSLYGTNSYGFIENVALDRWESVKEGFAINIDVCKVNSSYNIVEKDWYNIWYDGNEFHKGEYDLGLNNADRYDYVFYEGRYNDYYIVSAYSYDDDIRYYFYSKTWYDDLNLWTVFAEGDQGVVNDIIYEFGAGNKGVFIMKRWMNGPTCILDVKYTQDFETYCDVLEFEKNETINNKFIEHHPNVGFKTLNGFNTSIIVNCVDYDGNTYYYDSIAIYTFNEDTNELSKKYDKAGLNASNLVSLKGKNGIQYWYQSELKSKALYVSYDGALVKEYAVPFNVTDMQTFWIVCNNTETITLVLLKNDTLCYTSNYYKTLRNFSLPKQYDKGTLYINFGEKTEGVYLLNSNSKVAFLNDLSMLLEVETKTGLFLHNGKYYHFVNGSIVLDTTLVKYNGKYHYVKNGIYTKDTTLVKYNGKYLYVKNGIYTKDTTLVKYNGKYLYVKDGVYTKDTTLVKYNGKYLHVKNGVYNKDITHIFKTTSTTKATLAKNGNITKKCTACGKTSKSTIKYAKSFKLSTTTYTYNGKNKTPTVTVKDSAGKKLKKNVDYTLSVASSRKKVGTYKVTIKMKGKYSGTKTLTFKINPAKTSVSKLTAGKKSITVNISKKSTQVSGYQVQYSTSKKFTSAKTKTISSYKTTKYTLKSLSAKKTYYVRVRTYKTVSGKKYYSGWSTYKYVKTK